MRYSDIAKGLILAVWASALPALEVEDRKSYPGEGGAMISVLSTADLDVFEPFIRQFQQDQPAIGVDYTVASSTEIYAAITEGMKFDIVLSSAMDLQFQLANDGYAQAYGSDATARLPDWAQWRDLVFAFTSEPAVAVISRERFSGIDLPATRQELISILRDYPERFDQSVGTYDVRTSGLGYLFATQEARNSDVFWRLSEVIGRLQPRLYCCSAQMIDDVISGELAIAYNVLGSYAERRRTQEGGDRMEILQLEDFGNNMLRTALIPRTAENVTGAGAFLDALILAGLAEEQTWAFPPLQPHARQGTPEFGPIRLGPALMVHLDPLTRRAFLSSWEDAMEQE
ncbi:ABC transporter substrate-binding protein [Yoonia litorea]|uniref:Iron(III) transport system substrate-binding protein n=1 Tax=Yoonia litorea TaxID=1123755 RepID=A0A1I6M680_9RHOB|nr:substrate-binding domain-containing protein [Yoonia litorea]SFS11230.1 iron(III) transport system substrate-binding protein [Yoonia litorea]